MELNDDIDDIFNRLNEESNFHEPWEGAWEKMEIKLDKGYQKHPSGFSTLKKFGIAAGLLTSILIGTIIFNLIIKTNTLDKKSNSEIRNNISDQNDRKNQKNDLKFEKVDKKTVKVNVKIEDSKIDLNKETSNPAESNIENLVINSTPKSKDSNKNSKNASKPKSDSKALIKTNLKIKDISKGKKSQNAEFAETKRELSTIANKRTEIDSKTKEKSRLNNSKTVLGSSDLNKPVSNDLISNNNDLTTETKTKTRNNKVLNESNLSEVIFEKSSIKKISKFIEYDKKELRNSTELKLNDNEELNNSDLDGQNIDKIVKKDAFRVDALKKINSVNLLSNFMFKNKPSNYSIPDFKNSSIAKPIYSPNKGIALRLGYSPDVSLIKGHSTNKVGNNFNAHLEWRISSKWTVNSGVIKSLKYYDAYPEQYNWPANWKKPPNPLLEINATCNMLDIPINIRYDLKAFKNGLFFIKTGLTSYVMLKEKYVYDYENNDDPLIKWKKWEGSTGNYKLGVINLATGIELKYRKNIFVQIEPFAKIPIKEIGFGKVMLSTYGVFVSTKIPLINFK